MLPPSAESYYSAYVQIEVTILKQNINFSLVFCESVFVIRFSTKNIKSPPIRDFVRFSFFQKISG
jgi:hypothetical protein